MKKLGLIIITILSFTFSKAQTTIITDDSTYTQNSTNAIMEIHSLNGNKGILIPRLTTVQRTAISTSAVNDNSLLVYDTDTKTFWYFDGTAWVEIATGGTVTDDQLLTFSNDTLYIENGNSVYLGTYLDNTDNQTLSLSGSNLSISNGNTVTLPTGTDDQNIQGSGLSGNNLTIGIENGTSQTIDLSQFMDNTDNQNLSLSGTTINITNGTGVDISSAITSTAWSLTGNSGTTAGTNFLGTTDNISLSFKTNNTERMRILNSGNVGIGTTSPQYSLDLHSILGITDGTSFVVLSEKKMRFNENDNFQIGSGSGYSGMTSFGSIITIEGTSHNVGIGTTSPGALLDVHGHIWETGTGYSTFLGEYAGNADDLTTNYNVYLGYQSGQYLSDDNYNTLVGARAFYIHTSAYNNYCNTALGYAAGAGTSSIKGSTHCTYIGYDVDGSTNNLTNSTAVGNSASISASNQVRIGNSSVSSIGGYASWSNLSDKRYKKNIKNDVPGLDFILELQPVTYNLNVNKLARDLNEDRGKNPDELTIKSRQEKSKIRYSGFLAQDVEKITNKIGYDFSGIDKPKNDKDFYAIRYAEFVVPIVKAIQEQQNMINQLKKENKILKKEIQELKNK